MNVENLELKIVEEKKKISQLNILICYFYSFYNFNCLFLNNTGFFELTTFSFIKNIINISFLPIFPIILLIKNDKKIKYILYLLPPILILISHFPDPTSSVEISYLIFQLIFYILLIIPIFIKNLIKNYQILAYNFNTQSVKKDEIIHMNVFYIIFSYILLLSYLFLFFLSIPMYSLAFFYLYFPLKRYFKGNQRKLYFFDNFIVKFTTYLSFISHAIFLVIFMLILFLDFF